MLGFTRGTRLATLHSTAMLGPSSYLSGVHFPDSIRVPVPRGPSYVRLSLGGKNPATPGGSYRDRRAAQAAAVAAQRALSRPSVTSVPGRSLTTLPQPPTNARHSDGPLDRVACFPSVTTDGRLRRSFVPPHLLQDICGEPCPGGAFVLFSA